MAVRAATPLPLTARVLTWTIVAGPLVALSIGIPLMWDGLISLRDVVIGGALYVLAALGVTVGYHRLFAHRAFRATRVLKVCLAAAGSVAVEGSVVGWVANHRRHHRFSDRPGDPHSPHVSADQPLGLVRGLAHAHVGWLFADDPTDETTYARDLIDDPDLARMGRLWGWFAIGSLVLPFGLGWALSGSLVGGLQTFLWAGVARMALLHHITWGVNSICHTFGPQPFRTRDQSRNVAYLGIVSMGDSFHNFHHASPTSARHGVLPHQWDPAAGVIRGFERLGWATDVHWPSPGRIEALRRPPRTDRTHPVESRAGG